MRDPDAFLDGCDIDMAADPSPDDSIAALTLFADVDPDDEAAIAERRAEWQEVFGAGS